MAVMLSCSTGGFPLGVDWSKPAEALGEQSLVQAHQCEYDPKNNALKTVQGVRIIDDVGMPVESLYYDEYRLCWYYSSGHKLYKTDFTTKTLLGNLSGFKRPQFTTFGGDVLIASGGKLQAISGSGQLGTVESPVCEFVSTHAGSVLIASSNDHRLHWSAIGDYSGWTNDTNDSSSAQYVDVGYKDRGSIVAVDFLSKAVLVYKDYGKVYTVVGNPHDGTLGVYPLSQTGFCSGATISVDDRSYYLGSSGFMSFVPTDTYADIQPTQSGININSELTKLVDSSAAMWHVSSRKQIWIKVNNSNDIYIYHYLPRYNDGRGVFTTRVFKYAVHDVVQKGTDVYIAYGTKIGMLDDALDTDDGMQLQTSIVSGNRLALKQFIILMNYSLVISNLIPGHGELQISDKKPRKLQFVDSSQKIYDAVEKIADNTKRLISDNYTKLYKVGGSANRAMQIRLTAYKGAISLRQFDYNYIEV